MSLICMSGVLISPNQLKFIYAGFEELTCHCGSAVLYPPIPCGTLPPECNKLCSRRHTCPHPGKNVQLPSLLNSLQSHYHTKMVPHTTPEWYLSDSSLVSFCNWQAPFSSGILLMYFLSSFCFLKINYFQVTLCLCFKASLGKTLNMKMS